MKHHRTILAIVTTKYCGPTGSKGGRISVTMRMFADGSTKRKVVGWLHQYGVHDNHQSAAHNAVWNTHTDIRTGMGLQNEEVIVDGWSHDGTGHWVAYHCPVAPRGDNSGRLMPGIDTMIYNIGHCAGVLGNHWDAYMSSEQVGSYDGKAILASAAEANRLAGWMRYHADQMKDTKAAC
jgi:hypothetical protein